MKKYLSEFGGNPSLDNAEPRSTDIAWLAGVFDGEGSIIFGPKESGTTKRPQIGFHITNTDMELICKAQSIIQQVIKRPIHLSKKPAYTGAIIKNTKDVFTIDLRNNKDVHKLLNLLLPFLTSKRRKSKLVYDFLSFRLVEREQKGMINRYSDRSLALCKYVMENWSGVTTEREAPFGMKPQSELYGNIKSSTEMIEPRLN